MALKLRRGTNSGRTAITPAEGEPIFTTDTKQLYIGDGTTAGGVAVGGGVSDGDKGDITVSSSGATWTIDNDAVSYAKIQNVSAASRLLGRGSASGSGDVQELTIGTGLTLTGTELSASGGGGGLVNFAETYNLDTARIQPNGAATDIGIVISPKGNGAIQASMRTDSSVGGNIRGTNAIDLQMTRSASTQVAAANRSVIIGGVNGTVNSGATDAGMYSAGTNSSINTNGTNSIIIGGTGNLVSGSKAGTFCADSGQATNGNAIIIGSSYSGASAYGATVLNGASCYAMGSNSVTLGGENNNAGKQGSVAMGIGSYSNHSEYALCIGGTYSTGRSTTEFVTLNRNTSDAVSIFKLYNGAGNQPTILNYEAIGIKAIVVAKEYNYNITHYGMWEVEALVTRFAGTNVIQYSNVTTKVTSDAAMVVGFQTNSSPSELNITFTGRANMQVTATMQMTIVNRQ